MEPPPNLDASERFMRRAIDLSRQGVRAGDGGPFGAVIVKDGVIVGEGWNRVIGRNDPTAHGEIEAIRDASKRMNTFNLEGCDLYTTAEPCPMCLGAIYWARIARVFQGIEAQEATSFGFDDVRFQEQIVLPPERRLIPQRSMLADEARRVFQEYRAKPDKVPY